MHLASGHVFTENNETRCMILPRPGFESTQGRFGQLPFLFLCGERVLYDLPCAGGNILQQSSVLKGDTLGLLWAITNGLAAPP